MSNTSPQPGSLIPRQEAGDGKQAACVDTKTADVNSLPRSEVLTLRCLLSRQSQTVPQPVSVRWGCHCRYVLSWTVMLDPNITFFNVQGKNEDGTVLPGS